MRVGTVGEKIREKRTKNRNRVKSDYSSTVASVESISEDGRGKEGNRGPEATIANLVE